LGPILAAAVVWLGFIGSVLPWNAAIWPYSMERYGLPFMDMHGHLASSQAFADGTLVPGQPVPGDPMQRIHAGPTWMLWLGFLGLGPAQTFPFTAFCLAALLVTLALTLRPRDGFEAATLFLGLTGPPLMLLVERGNIDLLVFVALAGAFALLARATSAPRWSGWALIAGFIGFKYYPALAFAGVTETRGSRREKWLGLLLGAAATLAFIGWSLQEIRYVSDHQVENRFFPFFGSREIFVMSGYGYAAAARAGPLAWLVLAAGLARLLGPLSAPERQFDARKVAFAGGAAILLFCFLVTTSPDYRLVFVLFCLPWLWALRQAGTGAPRALQRLATLVLVVLVVAPWSGPLLARGVVALEATRLWWAALFLKQAGWWALTVSLGALLIRQLYGRARELLGLA